MRKISPGLFSPGPMKVFSTEVVIAKAAISDTLLVKAVSFRFGYDDCII